MISNETNIVLPALTVTIVTSLLRQLGGYSKSSVVSRSSSVDYSLPSDKVAFDMVVKTSKVAIFAWAGCGSRSCRSGAGTKMDVTKAHSLLLLGHANANEDL